MRSILLALILSASAYPLNAANIVKCQDDDGSISYAEDVCPGSHEQVKQIRYKEYRASKRSSQRNLDRAAVFPEPERALSKSDTELLQHRLVRVLELSIPVRDRIEEFYREQQKWPLSLADLGFKSREMTSQYIRKTRVNDKGYISLNLSDEFGPNKEIWLLPKLEMGGTEMVWLCYTNFPASQLAQPKPQPPLCQSKYF